MAAVLDLERQRDLGDLLSTTFRLFGSHLAIFISLTLLVVAPAVILVDGVWGRGLVEGADATVPRGAQAVSTLLATVVLPPLVTALHVVVVQDLAAGSEPTVGSAFARGAARFVPAMLTVLLYTLAVLGGLILLVLPGIWIAVRLYLGAQAAVVDRLGPVDALRRSSELVKDHWWQTFGRLIVAGVVFALLAGILGALATAGDSGLFYIVLLVIAQAIALSLSAIFGTLLFFDLRARLSLPWQGSGLADPEAPERPALP